MSFSDDADFRVPGWMALKERLRECLDYTPHGTHTLDSIAEGILSGRYHWWVHGESGCITETLHYPRGAELGVVWGFGDIAQLRELMSTVVPWAQQRGFTRIRVFGRPGWAKVIGAEIVGAVMVKEI